MGEVRQEAKETHAGRANEQAAWRAQGPVGSPGKLQATRSSGFSHPRGKGHLDHPLRARKAGKVRDSLPPWERCRPVKRGFPQPRKGVPATVSDGVYEWFVFLIN